MGDGIRPGSLGEAMGVSSAGVVGFFRNPPEKINRPFAAIANVGFVEILAPDERMSGMAFAVNRHRVVGHDGMHVFSWNGRQTILLDLPDGYSRALAYGISSDGDSIAGYLVDPTQKPEGYVYSFEAGLQTIGRLDGKGTILRAANPSGTQFVGSAETDQPGITTAIRYTGNEGIQILGPGTANDVAANGTVVGESPNWDAFVWTELDGYRLIADVARDLGVILQGFSLRRAKGISDDGNTIVGEGRDASGSLRGWVLTGLEPKNINPNQPATLARSELEQNISRETSRTSTLRTRAHDAPPPIMARDVATDSAEIQSSSKAVLQTNPPSEPHSPSSGIKEKTTPLAGTIDATSQYSITGYPEEAGVPSGDVFEIAVDPSGYLWLATQFGLARFDGIDFEVWTSANLPEITDNRVHALSIASDGTIVFATAKDLIQVQGHRVARIEPTNHETPLAAGAILAYPEHLWLGGDRSLAHIHQDTVVGFYTERDGLNHRKTASIFRDSDGTLWAGTHSGLLRFVPETNRFTDQLGDWTLSGQIVNAILRDRQGRIWILPSILPQGVHAREIKMAEPEETWRTFDAPDASNGGRFHGRFLVEDLEGYVWAAAGPGGLYRSDGAKMIRVQLPKA